MKKNQLLFALLLLLAHSCFAQVLTPEEFLGYKIGSRYTPHWRLVDYYKHVAEQAKDMVKLQPYGFTNEGRPLMVAYVATPSNLSGLETIRQNNLKLTQTTGDAKTTNVSGPVIVWLSFNVHGNETSSSEASMLALYALVDPKNAETKEWLKNTVVIIDPCINPDGRDRYVNWYNSVVGKKPNPLLEAREHDEPWPGGRTNHYNFDLNRDWAWQTQVESQQRMKLYNQWLPQIHVDFHEQGINNPYYFAPAAQPYHEVITPWQRSFQEIIGRNHARYFDEKGWLYFTKEVFDLLYPSYGDTYPTYTGSIGMTYEQAGGPASGAAALTRVGDTLTLYDRAIHHYTTSLSTIEIASKQAAKLLTEYQKFFSSAISNGVGEYKTYIIKNNPQDAQRIATLINVLDKNGITYGTTRAANFRGLNYNTGREESFSASSNDLVISTHQPRGTLVSVLFEPNTKVVDSVTYDITAWSLPYAYGLQAFAVKQNITPSNSFAFANNTNNVSDAYGYVFRWNGVQSVKLLSQLVQKGIRVRFSKQPFESGGQSFERGAAIILKSGNQNIPNFWNTLGKLADSFKVELTPVRSGFVDKGYDFGSTSVAAVKAKRIALLTGEGINSNAAGEVWHFFDQQIDYPVTRLDVAEINNFDLDQFDVLIMPDGNYRFLTEKGASEQLRNWIQKGGNLIAMEGAVAQLSRLDWSIKTKKEDSSVANDPYVYLRKYENRERDFIPSITPGSIFKVELDNTHPLAFGYPNYYYTLKQDNAIYEFIKEDGWNVGVLKRDKQVAGFVGSRISKRFQDGLLFGTQELGRGNITYLADNVLFRSFWENGKLMFANAVFLVGQ